MNVTLTILGRSTVDQPFTQLVAPAVIALAGAVTGYTPALPPGAAGQELRLRVAPDVGLTVDVGPGCDPATRPGPTPIKNDSGAIVGEEPAPAAMALRSVGVWAGYTRDLPFGPRETFALRSSAAATT